MQRDGISADRQLLALQSRFAEIADSLAQELQQYAPEGARITASGQTEMVFEGAQNAERLAKAAIGKAPKPIGVNWNATPQDALRNLIGFASDGSPISDLYAQVATDTGMDMHQALINGLASGDNPRTVAATFSALSGMAKARTETIARTEMLRAMRESSRQSFAANPAVVTGWTWVAACDARTCPACWAMHGTEHEATEMMASHVNCRCVMTPRTPSWAELTSDDSIPDSRPTIESGEVIFNRLSEPEQREILGNGLYEQWRQRDDFGGLARMHTDARWGNSVRPVTIAEYAVEYTA
jgi:hypothetical protein